MAVKRTEKRGSFQATGSDGRIYTVDIWVQIVNVANRANPNAEADGLIELITSDGLAVNRLDTGRYEIPAIRLALTSDDLNAI
jgi:hypothetical protein